jgi:hypothetical protein
MAYDVDAIRKKLKQSQAGKFVDPDEFKPEKAKSSTEPVRYRFFVLPPFGEGETLKSGTTKRGMEQFFVQHANHWVNDRPHPCPRVWDGTECPVCQMGFDLLRDEKDEDRRRAIIKQWMPTTYYAVNIYFPAWKHNPEELRGRVKWYNAPKTCFDIWSATLMKEDAGDPEEPEAFGVFFDETCGFLFQLDVLKHGRQNSYKTSKFLGQQGKGVPMIKNQDGSANETQIAKLLRMRHNLFDKLEEPDLAKINRLYRVMAEGDDEDDESGGFDKDETADKPKNESKPPKTEKPKTESKKAEEPEEEDVVTHLADDDDEMVDTGPVDDDDEGKGGDALADEAPLEEKKTSGGDDDDDVSSDEIESLLNQLADDDD